MKDIRTPVGCILYPILGLHSFLCQMMTGTKGIMIQGGTSLEMCPSIVEVMASTVFVLHSLGKPCDGKRVLTRIRILAYAALRLCVHL